FFAGLLLARINKFITLRGGFWWCSLAVALLLIMPRVGSGSMAWTNGLYEAICILVLFPLIVAVGAGSKMTDARTTKACKVLGELSYPLYIIHYPLVYMQMSWLNAHKDAPLGQHIVLGVGVFFLSLGIAYAAYKLYDVPVRAWLRERLFKKSAA
ncbi:MAG TPA: acyltransferase family protein, partial [Prevotella sp.]